MIFQNRVLVREVSQTIQVAFPCSMGVVFYFDCHAAWERNVCCLRHLPGENAIFSFFSTPPPREAQKSRKCTCLTFLSAPTREQRQPQNRQKTASCYPICELNHIFYYMEFSMRDTQRMHFSKRITTIKCLAYAQAMPHVLQQCDSRPEKTIKLQFERMVVAWQAWFQDVVSSRNWAGSWVWVKQKILCIWVSPTTWGRTPWPE